MRTFILDVTTRVEVTFDETKFTPERMAEFNAIISDYGVDDNAFEQHAEHLAELAAIGAIDTGRNSFIEGYGPLDEAGIRICVDELSTSSELQFADGQAVAS